ncbi:MAG TPA: HAD family hydrolase [Thermomicrobiales bacterium]|jgi:FMN phosphatase YigB (HAD superfamily)|nr:HAD family hydrolase [Thermomicrobiales bacterium]
MSGQRIKAVVFDQGETLVDETRFWSTVAQYAGVPELTLHGVLGGLIERRESHRSLFGVMQIESVDPNVIGYEIEARDLYPDVVPVLKQLSHAGYRLGVSGNQPAGVVEQFGKLGLPLDLIASSTLWGVTKPDERFFARMAAELALEPGEIVYVGDRLDNDVLPAQEFGMHAVFIRRGPWGYLHAGWPEAAEAAYKIDRLTELPALVEKINRGG